MRNIYLIGGGGHCNSCIDVIEATQVFSIKGIFDLHENISKNILGYEIIGTDEKIKDYVTIDNYFLVTIGQIKSPEARKRAFSLLKNLNANLATVISPRAYVSRHASIEEGTIVMHGALVNANAIVGSNCIINTQSLIEHDSKIKDHCHISTAAIINGGCTVEEGSFIGSNSVLRERAHIKENSIVQAGSFFNEK